MSTIEQRKQRQTPVYIQIKEALIRDIQMYNKVGDMLASEFELSSIYNVNRHTLRRAVDELIKEGVVERHHGKGTIVRAPSIHYPIASRTRLTETLEAQGISTSSRVIRKQQVSARGGIEPKVGLHLSCPSLRMSSH
uniref:COG2188 Transcriptional regulators n=1 Tax=uncultured bacterium B3TF_MPn1 TaxID=1439866 RepID=W0NQF7_9BACT|nr:COG2188 Transcriptional regulators [uncultured bacterium B3TF_MPn1]